MISQIQQQRIVFPKSPDWVLSGAFLWKIKQMQGIQRRPGGAQVEM